ncbi:xylulokinase [Amycolatopsis dongchuanensis]|uniref:Xylulose kinase n=1 Tax=Amycolatopsis dongchuanensis TaxID=1070866 RepID=A0ABP9QBG9_9PSEU
MSGHVAAVDVGTSAVRAAIVRADGRTIAHARVERTSSVGGELYDPDALVAEVNAALRAVADAPAPDAVVVSAHIGAVVVDADARPIVPGGGWADRRGLDALLAAPDALRARIRAASGRPQLTGGALALLLSLTGDERRRARAVLSPKDHLVAALTDELATDTIDAAYTLASDGATGRWCEDVIAELGLDPGLFPPQLAPTATVGGLTAAAAAATGLPAGTPVLSGGPDGSVGIALLLGTSSEAVADVAGTTDVVGRLLPGDRGTADVGAGVVLNPSALPGRVVAGGATGLTGGAVAHWRGLVGAVADDVLDAVPPGADGLRVLPAMTGERFPRWRSDAAGGLAGQRPSHGPAHLLRAAQEAAAFTVREGIDVLDPGGELPVVFAGGSARSEAVARLRADVWGRPVRVAGDPDVTLRGAAALGLVGVGLLADLDEARRRLLGEDRVVMPDPARTRRYRDVYEEWRALRR